MNEKLLLPQSISLYVTYNCQLSCEHCFLTQTGKLNKYTLDIESIKRVIDEAHKHNVFLVAISGGDPLLHPNIYEILEFLQQKGIVAL
ncbi:radical SAM protein [Bacillus cytotoxicus]|uniref:radical SAM protein n=1 Tax=Bacillus cytotoxicus TaxID=580165 RepID=UPI0035CBF2A5